MLKFTQASSVSKLSDDEIVDNIALLKSGKDFDGKSKITDIEKFTVYLESELESRGWEDADIDIKVKEAMKGIENTAKGGFWGTSDKILDTADDVANIFGKFKGFFNDGGTYEEDDGSEYDFLPKEDTQFNYKPYIIGGVAFLIVVGGLLYFLSKKK